MTVRQTFEGDASRLIAELDKLNAAYAKLSQQMQDSSKRSEEGAARHDSMLKSAATQVVTLAAGYATWNTVIGVVNDSLERTKKRQEEILDYNLKLGQAQAELVRNAGQDFEDLAKRLEGVQRRTGVEMVRLTRAASAAVSGRPVGMPMAQVAGAVEAAARVMPEPEADLAGFTQATMQVMGATGVTDPRVAAGFMQSTAAVSAIPNAADVAMYAAPAIFAATVVDPEDRLRSAKEAAAMYAMFTKRGEARGRKAGTSTLGLIAGLAKFFEGRDDPGTTLGRVQVLQQDTRLRQAFLGEPIRGMNIALEQQAKNIFDPASPEFQMFQQNIAAIQIAPEPYERLAEQVSAATPQLRVARREREMVGTREQFLRGQELADYARIEVGKIVRQGIELSPEGTPLTHLPYLQGFGQTISDWSYRMGTRWMRRDPFEAGTNILTAHMAHLRKDGVTPSEAPQVQALQRMLDELQGLRAEVRQGRAQVMAGSATDQPSRHREN